MPLVGRDALILGAVRTPVGKGNRDKGMFLDVHPTDLLGRTFEGLLEQTGVDSSSVEEVITGCVYQVGEQSSGVGRNAWLRKGLAPTAGSITVDIRCGSGQQAAHFAALQVGAAVNDLVIAAGVEHMGRLGFPANADTQERWGKAFEEELLGRYGLVSQGEAAELIADQWQISRQEMDEVALRSHRLAAAATESGGFRRELVPIEAENELRTVDQGIRNDTTGDGLARIKPAFRSDGRVTAGNSSQISDGAAALMLGSAEKAAELGLLPRARIVDQVLVGVDPVTMLTGPIAATQRILERNGMTLNDIDLIEINEAFASVVVAWARELKPDMDRVNVRGGAIALGHPLGATGARLMTTLLHSLEDGDGEYGLVTMCCAGGLGTATLIQRV